MFPSKWRWLKGWLHFHRHSGAGPPRTGHKRQLQKKRDFSRICWNGNVLAWIISQISSVQNRYLTSIILNLTSMVQSNKGIIQWRDVTQFLSQKCPTFLTLPTFLKGSMGFCWEMLQETPHRSFMGKNQRPLLPTSRACHLQNTKETATVSEDSENSKCQKKEIE